MTRTFTQRSLFYLRYCYFILIYLDSKKLNEEQKLYHLLKKQNEAEIHEILHYSSQLKDIQNHLIRNYFHTLLTDGLKHVEYISKILADIEGGSYVAYLTKQGIENSILEEEESKNVLIDCLNLAQDVDTKEILKSIIVDEEHHIKILKHIHELVQNYSKDGSS